MASAYTEYLRSERWRTLRAEALYRDKYRCRLCDSRSYLEGHHRRYPRVLGEETVDDITTLCQNCHRWFSRRQHRRRSGARWALAFVFLLLLWYILVRLH